MQTPRTASSSRSVRDMDATLHPFGTRGPRLLPAVLLLAACTTDAGAPERREMPSEMVEGTPMYTVLPPDAIRALDEPSFVSAEEADSFLDPMEPVLGVVGADGTAKAYSAWQLERHEIVNDSLDGEPIAATW